MNKKHLKLVVENLQEGLKINSERAKHADNLCDQDYFKCKVKLFRRLIRRAESKLELFKSG